MIMFYFFLSPNVSSKSFYVHLKRILVFFQGLRPPRGDQMLLESHLTKTPSMTMPASLALHLTPAVYWKKVRFLFVIQFNLYVSIHVQNFFLNSKYFFSFNVFIVYSCQGNENETEETNIEEEFEEKLRDAIDGLSQKSAQGRTQCMEAISKAFTKRFIPDFVVDRYDIFI